MQGTWRTMQTFQIKGTSLKGKMSKWKHVKWYTCSQFFIGDVSDRWQTYPLKSESLNGTALQDYACYVGNPTSIKTDNAQSEIGCTWKKHCRWYCVPNYTTKPKSPWQNLAERGIQDLGCMVRINMRHNNAPLEVHDYCQEWCCDVHNILSNEKLKWRTPLEVNKGNTPDISKFRFHFYEPIWYYDASIKSPEDRLQKGQFLWFANTSGDDLSYKVLTEKATINVMSF